MEDKKEPHVAGLRSIKQEVEPGIYAWCSCGWSSNQPFCDGSHKGTGFKPYKLKIEERKRISWCNCKHTESPPICDGAHKKLPGYVPPQK